MAKFQKKKKENKSFFLFGFPPFSFFVVGFGFSFLCRRQQVKHAKMEVLHTDTCTHTNTHCYTITPLKKMKKRNSLSLSLLSNSHSPYIYIYTKFPYLCMYFFCEKFDNFFLDCLRKCRIKLSWRDTQALLLLLLFHQWLYEK